MNSYRKLYGMLLEVRFRMMAWKKSYNKPETFLAMSALSDAIKEADELASAHEQETHNKIQELIESKNALSM